MEAKMSKTDAKGLVWRIFVPAIILSLAYLILGLFFRIPHILLFCVLATLVLVPIELGIILKASKAEHGKYSLQSAFAGQEKYSVWKMLIIAFVFFSIAGLLSTFIAPIENQALAAMRSGLLNRLPRGFAWTDFEHLKTFSRPILIVTCACYSIFNVLIGPITEELFFRGYLTSHYEKQTPSTPIIIAVLFSLHHLWLPFNNVFRMLAFAPVTYIAYKKKNFYISICFHCLCNFFSSVGLALAILA